MRANRNLLAGLAAGITGAVLLGLFVATSGPATPADAAPTLPVLVAGGELPAETRAEGLGGAIRTVEAPATVVPARALRDLEDVAGQRLVRRVGEGEILTLDQFGSPGPAPGGVIVPAGYEAISLELSPAPGMAGYATPGSKVNVYGVFTEQAVEPEAGQLVGRPFTQLVLGHVTVLAVTRGTLTGEAQDPAREAGENHVVLLLQVHPSDIPVLVFAQSQGALWFTLVNDEDPAPSAARVQLDELDPAARSAAIAASVARQREEEAAR